MASASPTAPRVSVTDAVREAIEHTRRNLFPVRVEKWLILGFLTPLALIVGIFLNLNYISLAGVKPKDITVNPAYQCEQGQNWNMLVAEVVLLFTAAGCTWSLDSLLGIFCGARHVRDRYGVGRKGIASRRSTAANYRRRVAARRWLRVGRAFR